MAKKIIPRSGIVFSTDPGYSYQQEEAAEQAIIPNHEQQLKIKLETKQRGGKAVTLVLGFTGPETARQEIGKKLKTFCGTGGSVKDGEIIIQGDNRDKVLQWLIKEGFTKSRKA